MKVKDLPEDTQLEYIKLKIPKEYLTDAKLAGMTKEYCYLFSSWFCGIWIKEDPKSTRMFPLQVRSEQVLEWDVCDE